MDSKNVRIRTRGGRELVVGDVIVNGDWLALDELAEGDRELAAANSAVFELSEAPAAPASTLASDEAPRTKGKAGK
jgi:hypothetical protein